MFSFMRTLTGNRSRHVVGHCAMLLALLTASTSAQAACKISRQYVGEVQTSVYTVNFGALPSFDPTVPDGTILARAQSPMQDVTTNIGSCTNPNKIGKMESAGIGPIDARFNTYATSIAGIGLRVGQFYAGSSLWWNPLVSDLSGADGFTFLPTYTFVVEIVKTGPITAAGTLTGDIGKISLVNHGQVAVLVRLGGAVAIKPLVPGCKVMTPKISVPLGKVPMSTLNRDGQSADKPFDINLQCSGGTQGATTRMFITLTDGTNAGNRSTILGLAPGSAAEGVGVQIMNQSTPVSLGPDSSATGNPNQWFVTETGNQNVTIPLSARYVVNGAALKAGTADAVATFTMSYQ
ncbi:fimbrial protein [Burkholderia sp. IMCC1007]|uniref:fimbrial protein n=1 Tax=Burkholderia sp. IMCC1007 TaxID=3004104 RepID=UPI0022B56523|nr:fimbrial protein [Burkholderia sp. IMCC1007]